MTMTTEPTFQTGIDDGDTPGSDSRKRVMVLAGVGVLLAAGAGFYLLHSGSSGSTANSGLVPSHHALTAHPNPAAKAAAPVKKASSKVTAASKATTILPTASNVQIQRDPFKALYVVPAGGNSASTSTGTASTSSASTTTSATSPGTTSSGTASTASTAPYTLTLLGMSTAKGGAELSTFKYSTVTKAVLPAERFGKYGEVVVLDYVKNSAGQVIGDIVQVGDDDPIEITIGEKISIL